ncbi:SAM-dependent methyltransferase [Aestuariivirga litoralis]|uniref:SAM-dependent methyltransferase n=1 Tax=Aestuariivirga litoralis TaxID=2650924 RepID=UPI0018C57F5B|nr:cyclopropane-fatty-acyl-phospholipid synthase family protein [Aestuariivirga litoralis]MBG1231935.1 class I SAM-dependent methyltransferase [Aestuariivirga litoralis]
MIWKNVLKKLIKKGDLTVTDWNGRISKFGNGGAPKSHVKFGSLTATTKAALDPDLRLGEAYMSGDLEILYGTLYDFLELILINTGNGMRNVNGTTLMHKMAYQARIAGRKLTQHNIKIRSRKNVQVHYDLSGKLYDLFLDKDKQYSCAYFENDTATLEQAQLAKKRHIAAKLDIKPGMKILDIGSGWGGMGFYLAEMYGADVTGVTLSDEQVGDANAQAKALGVSDRVRFLLEDYRALDQKFDRIVSVGMFEHVGVGHFAEFFKKVSHLLKPDGTALLHSINRADGPGATGAWMNKYIFPGGYAPALSEVIPHLERNDLYVTDIEILRTHYARTLREWTTRFMAHREEAKALYDERFCRMWEFYLVGAELTFRYMSANNFQIQFGHDQHFLPVTRDYMVAEEARLRKLERKSPQYKSIV